MGFEKDSLHLLSMVPARVPHQFWPVLNESKGVDSFTWEQNLWAHISKQGNIFLCGNIPVNLLGARTDHGQRDKDFFSRKLGGKDLLYEILKIKISVFKKNVWTIMMDAVPPESVRELKSIVMRMLSATQYNKVVFMILCKAVFGWNKKGGLSKKMWTKTFSGRNKGGVEFFRLIFLKHGLGKFWLVPTFPWVAPIKFINICT